MENNTTPPAQPATPNPAPVTPPPAPVVEPTPPPAATQPTPAAQTAPPHNGHYVAKIIALILVAVNILLALYIIVMLLGR